MIMDPDINTTIIDVIHTVEMKITSTTKYSKHVKVKIPIVIAGFPYLLFEEAITRRSVDTLPLYNCENQSSDGDSTITEVGLRNVNNLEDLVTYRSDQALTSALLDVDST